MKLIEVIRVTRMYNEYNYMNEYIWWNTANIHNAFFALKHYDDIVDARCVGSYTKFYWNKSKNMPYLIATLGEAKDIRYFQVEILPSALATNKYMLSVCSTECFFTFVFHRAICIGYQKQIDSHPNYEELYFWRWKNPPVVDNQYLLVVCNRKITKFIWLVRLRPTDFKNIDFENR